VSEWREFPPVGSRVRRDFGPGNPNTWRCAGEVRAVVDGEVMVVRRWMPRARWHRYETVDRIAWDTWKDSFHVLPPKKAKKGGAS
jgi:hypothetical protein